MGKRARALATVAGLALGGMGTAYGQTDPGLVTLVSHHDVPDTIRRFEAAVEAKGWVVFTTIDHAAAAKAAGLDLLPRTVIVFGNPKAGTDPMRSNPTLAIDLPMKALVWRDPAGKVWLTYNSADYVGGSIYPRHGFEVPAPARQGMADLFADLAHKATE